MVGNPEAGWSAYEIYYGKQMAATASCTLDNNLVKLATTEYGLTAVVQIVELVSHKDRNSLISMDEFHELMQHADNLYKAKAMLLKEAKTMMDFEKYDEFNAEDQMQQLINFTEVKVVGRAEAQGES